MKNSNSKGNRNRWLLNIILVTIAVLSTICVIHSFIRHINNQSSESIQTTQSVEKNPDSIAIPGYELLELQANSTAQTLCLPNPEQNVCYFQISLSLGDGTLLWQSDLVAPGDTSKPMTLTKALDKGTYPNAILKYSCFAPDGITPLNGAETKITLWVK